MPPEPNRVRMEDYLRLEDVLVAFWDKIDGEKRLPGESMIDPDHLADIWDDCFLVETFHAGGYRYDYMGKNLIEAYGDAFPADEVTKLMSEDAHRTAEKFQEVMDTKKPVHDEGEFVNSHHMMIKYRQLLLPFGTGDGEVKYILGGMRWKAY